MKYILKMIMTTINIASIIYSDYLIEKMIPSGIRYENALLYQTMRLSYQRRLFLFQKA